MLFPDIVCGWSPEKISVSARHGITTVFIPYGSQSFGASETEKTVLVEVTNTTVNTTNNSKMPNNMSTNSSTETSLVEHGLEKGVTVVEVGTLDDVLEYIFEYFSK